MAGTPTTTQADPGTPARIGRRLRPLQIATMLQGVAPWIPVEKLFMSEIGFDPSLVAAPAAAYAAVVPVLEIPSGILADRWSRRRRAAQRDRRRAQPRSAGCSPG